MEVIETSCTPRTSSRKRVRAFVTAAVAASALSVPALSALSVTAHSAAGKGDDSKVIVNGGSRLGSGGGGGISPDSHRLAVASVKPDSLRLT